MPAISCLVIVPPSKSSRIFIPINEITRMFILVYSLGLSLNRHNDIAATGTISKKSKISFQDLNISAFPKLLIAQVLITAWKGSSSIISKKIASKILLNTSSLLNKFISTLAVLLVTILVYCNEFDTCCGQVDYRQ